MKGEMNAKIEEQNSHKGLRDERTIFPLKMTCLHEILGNSYGKGYFSMLKIQPEPTLLTSIPLF